MRPPRSPWDAAWKSLVQQVFHSWLAYFFPEVAACVDPNHPPDFLETELQKIAPEAARGRGHVDRLVRVRLLGGGEAFLIIHLEIQSQKDPEFPLRLLVYHVTLFLHHGLPVTSLVLLADPARRWRPDRAVVETPGSRLTLEYGVCKLWDLDPGPPRPGEPVLNHVVRAWRMTRETTGDAVARKEGRVRLLKALVEAASAAGCSRDEAAAAVRFLDSVAVLPAKLEEQYLEERKLIMMEIENFEPITYAEKKAFREGRLEAQRESALRMAELGMDLPTIAKVLRLSKKKVQALLEAPAQTGATKAARP